VTDRQIAPARRPPSCGGARAYGPWHPKDRARGRCRAGAHAAEQRWPASGSSLFPAIRRYDERGAVGYLALLAAVALDVLVAGRWTRCSARCETPWQCWRCLPPRRHRCLRRADRPAGRRALPPRGTPHLDALDRDRLHAQVLLQVDAFTDGPGCGTASLARRRGRLRAAEEPRVPWPGADGVPLRSGSVSGQLARDLHGGEVARVVLERTPRAGDDQLGQRTGRKASGQHLPSRRLPGRCQVVDQPLQRGVVPDQQDLRRRRRPACIVRTRSVHRRRTAGPACLPPAARRDPRGRSRLSAWPAHPTAPCRQRARCYLVEHTDLRFHRPSSLPVEPHQGASARCQAGWRTDPKNETRASAMGSGARFGAKWPTSGSSWRWGSATCSATYCSQSA
jgi:hypothetical protein